MLYILYVIYKILNIIYEYIYGGLYVIMLIRIIWFLGENIDYLCFWFFLKLGYIRNEWFIGFYFVWYFIY